MNLIVICLDTLRYDVVRHSHPVAVATPILDALAAESAVFTAAFGEGEPTIPVRRALFSGMRSFPWRFDYDTAGVWPSEHGWHRIPSDQPTLAEILLAQGYKTALIADTYHMFKPTMNFTRGFINYEFVRGQETDNWRGGAVASVADRARLHKRGDLDPTVDGFLLQYLLNTQARQSDDDWHSARVFRAAADWLDANHTERPFFLWIDSFDSHEPWDPPRRYADRYAPHPGQDGKEFIMPANYGGEATPEEQARIRALYYGEVTWVDELIGRFLAHVRRLDLLDDTLLMVLSDHGTELQDHGRWGKNMRHLYAHNTQLNWLIRHPDGRGRGRELSQFTQNHDVTPTALALLGVEAPPLDGQDQSPFLRDEPAEERDFVVTGWGEFASVRDREWNYIVKFGAPDEETRLYDLRADPGEQTDVAAGHPGVVTCQRARLEALLGQPLPARLTDRVYPSTLAIRAYYRALADRRQREAGMAAPRA
ncbi:MAG: sulfatase [Thermomicrobiales bacterium]